jgi:two-component system, chemotaxis family, protein-glutamate methylesterase/glutaminase
VSADASSFCRVVMGGSAGSVAALEKLLPGLRPELAVALVLHIPPRRASQLAAVLGAMGPLPAKEVDDKEPFRPGAIYIAPPDYHLLVEPDLVLSLSTEAPELYSRPSINILFETAARALGPDMAAVVLSGANEDGARGAAEVRARGGRVFVQAPASAEYATMPQAVLSACPDAVVLPPERLAAALNALLNAV